MKRIEPQRYLKRLKRKFLMEPLFKLNEEMIKKHSREFDRRVEVAKLFIPELEKIGPYDVRYDLATTMVQMIAPFDKRIQIMKYLCEHYKIKSVYPWYIDSLEDFFEAEEIKYHPELPVLLFSHPDLPISRFKDFSELLKAIRIFQNVRLAPDQFYYLFLYYAWKSEEFKLSPIEIDIINAVLPYYPHTIEEINIILGRMFQEGFKTIEGPKFVRQLVDKMERDYKTVKKYLDRLKSQKLFRQVLWVDPHFFGIDTLIYLLPEEYKVNISSSNPHRIFKLKSPIKNLDIFSIPIPLPLTDTFHEYMQRSIKRPVKAYRAYNIPLIHYNFKFFDREKNKLIINWEQVDWHFKNCELSQSKEDFLPIHPAKGDIDSLTLKIFDYLSGNANLSNAFLQQALNVPLQNITTRRRDLEKKGLRFPYIYSIDCPELYFFKANISKISEIDYCIRLLSIFPMVFHTLCRNIQDPNDHFLLSWIHLPIGSYSIFNNFGKNSFPFNYELYYAKIMTYSISFRLWELFDDDKKRFDFKFENYHIKTN